VRKGSTVRITSVGRAKAAPLSAIALLAGASFVPDAQGQVVPPCPVRVVTQQVPAASAKFGFAVAGLGDVNGDSYADFAVGAPGAAGFGGAFNAGRVTIHSGRTGAVFLSLNGAAAGDQFGFSVARLGDLSSPPDGVPDFVVGAPTAGLGGRAYVVSGTTGTSIHILLGTVAGGQFGYSVAGIGDLNGNSFSDVLVGAPGVQKVFVYDGQTGNQIWTVTGATCTYFGRVVAAVGDVTSDGVPDVAVGVLFPGCSQLGQVHFYSGASVGTGTPIATIGASGVIVGSYWTFGSAVAGLEDMSTPPDGFPDFAVGDPGVSQVTVRSGANGSIIQTLTGAPTFGGGAANAGDLNGDGMDDLMVGAPSAGDVKVFSLALSPPAAIYAFTGTLASVAYGDPVAVVGSSDEDGDGLTDVVLIGNPNASAGGLSGAGSVSLLSIGIPPGSSTFGTGCNASGGAFIPAISVLGGPPLASTGNPATGFLAMRVRGGTAAAFILGATNAQWMGVPLPISLAPLMLPGCSLAVSADVFFYATTTGTVGSAGDGVSYVAIPVPMNPALVGMHAYGQWYVVDPGPNAVPGSMSAAVDLVL
jgi:hypothetical protein